MQGYRFRGTRIAVAGDDAALLGWLGEFLAPSFEAWSGSSADFEVAIRTEPSSYALLASSRPPGALPELACFALDSDVARHPSWTDAGRTLLADEKLGALYRLGDRRVEVIPAPDAPAPRFAAMRVVREIAATSALASGEVVQLHAAVLEHAGRGLLVAGPKGAGKTTVLCYLAGAAAGDGARVVTNDRAIAAPSGDGFEVQGVPTIVSVRAPTLDLMPHLAWGLPDVERPAQLSLEEAEACRAARGELREQRRLRLSPPQLARQLGAPLAARARLAAIVLPETDPRPEALALEPIDPAAAARRLPAVLFGVNARRPGPTVFDRLVGASRPAHADCRGIQAIADRVPCFSLRIGSGRFGDPSAARFILANCP